MTHLLVLNVRVPQLVHDLDDEADEVTLVDREQAEHVQAARDEGVREGVSRNHLAWDGTGVSQMQTIE